MRRYRGYYYMLHDEDRFKILKTVVDLLERSNGKYILTTRLVRAELGTYEPLEKIREVLDALTNAKILKRSEPPLT